MLIEFEVGNYRSFKDPVRLSMVAANPIKEFLEENTFQAWRYRLLKSAAIYGANASGKSNLLHAMAFMRGFVLSSSKEMQVRRANTRSAFQVRHGNGKCSKPLRNLFPAEGSAIQVWF